MPIGPGGAAEVDDETRPTDLTPPTRRQTAGIITSRQGKGRGPGIYSGTAMGAFWGRLGARQGEKARSTCLVIPPRSVVELQNLTTAAAWGTRGQIRPSVDPRSAASPLIVLETTNRKTAFAREIRIEHSRGESVNRSAAAKAPFPFSLLSLPPFLPPPHSSPSRTHSLIRCSRLSRDKRRKKEVPLLHIEWAKCEEVCDEDVENQEAG